MDNDSHDIDHYLTGNLEDDLDPNPGVVNESGTLAKQSVSGAEKEQATLKWDGIVVAMWNNYEMRLQAAAVT